MKHHERIAVLGFLQIERAVDSCYRLFGFAFKSRQAIVRAFVAEVYARFTINSAANLATIYADSYRAEICKKANRR